MVAAPVALIEFSEMTRLDSTVLTFRKDLINSLRNLGLDEVPRNVQVGQHPVDFQDSRNCCSAPFPDAVVSEMKVPMLSAPS